MSALDQVVKLSVKKKIAVLLLIVSVIGVAFWFFYYSPLLDELDDLEQNYARLQREKNDANRRKATYEKDKQRLALLLVLLPFLIALGSWIGNSLAPLAARTHATVALAEQVWMEENQQVEETTDNAIP